MKATLTNLGTVPVPLTSDQNGGLAVSLDPGMPYTVDDDKITVATVGDNPSFREDLKEALGNLYDLALKLITFWKQHQAQPKIVGADIVNIRIVAGDTNNLRVTGDDKNLDQEVVKGSTRDVSMKDYIEIRQLGIVSADPNQVEAP